MIVIKDKTVFKYLIVPMPTKQLQPSDMSMANTNNSINKAYMSL